MSKLVTTRAATRKGWKLSVLLLVVLAVMGFRGVAEAGSIDAPPLNPQQGPNQGEDTPDSDERVQALLERLDILERKIASLQSPRPSVDISIDSTRDERTHVIPYGGGVTLKWRTERVTSCEASADPADPAWQGRKESQGTKIISAITVPRRYFISCEPIDPAAPSPGDAVFIESPGDDVFVIPLSVSCEGVVRRDSSAKEAVFTATVRGGAAPYVFSWEGSKSLQGSAVSVTKSYTTYGDKRAKVTVTSLGVSAEGECTVTLQSSPPPTVSPIVEGTQQPEDTNAGGQAFEGTVSLSQVTGANSQNKGYVFGYVPPLESRDITLTVSISGGKPSTFSSVNGLNAPYAFKGGSYPGIGGTCGETLTKPCTIVLSYAPESASTENGQTGDGLRYRADLAFEAAQGQAKSRSNQFILFGRSRRNPLESLSLSITQPAPVAANDTSEFQIAIEPSNSDIVWFRNVAVTAPNAPFVLTENTCAALNDVRCHIRGRFTPTASGAFSSPIEVRVSRGTGEPLIRRDVLRGTALFSDTSVDPAQNVLIVYNKSWGESVSLFEEYVSKRPLFSSANSLALDIPPKFKPGCSETNLRCVSDAIEYIPLADIQSKIAAPVQKWIAEHPEKAIRFIVLMRGVPSRSADHVVQGSVQMILHTALGSNVFVTSLDLGSSSATRSYIAKLGRMFKAMQHTSVVISAKDALQSGDTFYFSDNQDRFRNVNTADETVKNSADAMSRLGAKMLYSGPDKASISSAHNVKGFVTWGYWGDKNGNWPIDGSIRFSGDSNWYIIQTVESHNGHWVQPDAGDDPSAHYQSNFIKWFSAQAFGGTNYEYTPVGAVTHTDEPSVSGVNSPALFTCWESNQVFSYCAWKSRRTIHFQAVGDPLVTT